MKELSDILVAFKDAKLNGRAAALATVVHVEGSSYRRPGARMLVEDNGKMTGAISGGCLEGDALRKALLAINQQRNKLVTYNTRNEDDNKFGIQLGCEGIVHILFEPIDYNIADNPVALLEKIRKDEHDVVLTTLFSLEGNDSQPGTCLLFDGEKMAKKSEGQLFEPMLKEAMQSVFLQKRSLLKDLTDHRLSAFLEYIPQPVSLIIVGAGNDAFPLVEMAKILGWKITLVDGRVTHANTLRFPQADEIIIAKPAESKPRLPITERTVIVLMTHNYNYDLSMMRWLLQEHGCYIGMLGPKKRLERMFTELEEQGYAISPEQRSKIFGPTGLDIGAETPEEVALSILAEIKAVLEARQGSFLRNREMGIHSRTVPDSNVEELIANRNT